jgi:hypothetical protein
MDSLNRLLIRALSGCSFKALTRTFDRLLETESLEVTYITYINSPTLILN